MSKEYDHFWKYHNKDNMDVHAVMLIRSLEAKNKRLREEIWSWVGPSAKATDGDSLTQLHMRLGNIRQALSEDKDNG